MHWIDWLFVILPMATIIAIVIYTQKYMRGVADFLSGGRMAGRYLLTVSKGEAGAGAVVFVALFEVISQSGFTMQFWGTLHSMLSLFIALSGFVIYRYRQTRAMTLAQFFEVRYSKSFRIFTGFLGFAAGIINFGIIPIVGARFLVCMLSLPPTFRLWGNTIDTSVFAMGILLALTLYMTLSSGLISLMLADCLEGIISQILYLVIIFGLIYLFSWKDIAEVLSARPPGQSFLNPFDSLNNHDFNLWFVLMGIFISLYGTMAWQNQSAFNSAAISAHESKMAGILSRWREMGKAAVIPLIAVCAMTFLSHPNYASKASTAHEEISAITDSSLRGQMTIPIAVDNMLPAGLRGALCIILLMGIVSGMGSHLHSWGSMLIQDVFVPIRKKTLEPGQHIRWLRWSISGVALFSFLFGALFHQMEYIQMWWSITMAIYVGGAGACIIGGLYWEKGTTQGAWAALLTGSLLSGGGIIARQCIGQSFPLNGQEISFGASLLAALVYVGVSLLTCKENYNMDRMLHRGVYAQGENNPEDVPSSKFNWGKLIGINENFTRGDKWIAGGLFAYSMVFFAVFLTVCIWNILSPWPTSWWAIYWHIQGIGLPILFAVITAIWFTWGGILDIRSLFIRLKNEKINTLDNGMVINNQNLDEVGH